MNGVLVVDKPAGMTSHDVVDRVRRVFGTRRVGHAGTLDPDATGILVVGVGAATRFLDYAKDVPKRYTAVATLGITTSTQDASGEVLSRHAVDATEETLRSALRSFVGEIEQIPPMVSAVKVGGEPLYRKARRGESVERRPRRVTIHALELLAFESPRVTLDVTCSAGTYIRTLVHDLGERLGCGAHVTDLRRTEAGGFGLEDAVPLDEVTDVHLRPVGDAVRALPRHPVGDEEATLVSHGRPLPAPEELGPHDLVAVVHRDELLAVYRRSDGELVADRVMPS